MANLVNAYEISKSFGSRPLFKGLTFAVDSGDRIGLIGPNGAGKSTLMKMIARQLALDDGTLSLQKGLRVGFLEQVPLFKPKATLLSSILEGSDKKDAALDWEVISEAQALISQFELENFEIEAPIESLSGGWKKRIALARELMRNPDLLLLDEPTNHLDIESILWLETFIAKAPFAVITITHDRLFLQNTSNRILELNPRHEGGILNMKGDYEHFLESRELLLSAQERRETILKNTLRRETEWLRQGAKARTTKQQARIQRAGELKDEVSDLTYRNQDRKVQIDFQSADKNPKKLVQAKAISKKYDGKIIFEKLNLLLSPGVRIGLLGRNGAGKSTLIRVLMNQEKPTSGEIFHSEHLSIAYFDQNRDSLDPAVSVSKTLCPEGDWVSYRGSRIHIRSYLDRFLFKPEQFEMAVGKLSGGEQSRLLIARLMMTEANILILDEPTNDLDMATLAVLEECLCEFDGAVILVTHDRTFLDQVATQILAFSPKNNGNLVSFHTLDQWESWHRGELQGQRKEKNAANTAKSAPESKKKKLGFNEQRELDSMESNIHLAEAHLAHLTQESTLSENLSNAVKLSKLTEEMAETQSKIDRLYQRWAELEKN